MGNPATIEIKRVERLSATAVRVTLDPGIHAPEWRNIPGGYMTFCLPCEEPLLQRSYSLVQGPEAQYPEVIVKETGSGRGSAFVNRKFKAGMRVLAYPPQGRMFPESWFDVSSHFVMFAAGAGITPIYSVMQHMVEHDVHHEITLFYGNTGLKDILLREELELLAQLPNVNVLHLLTDGSLDDELYNGRINASKAMLLWDTIRTTLPKKVLISGPASMKEDVLRGLDLSGVHPKDIRYEDFHHPPHVDKPDIPECKVTAEHGDQSTTFVYRPNEENLMESMMDRGFDVPHSCRGGVCGNCRAEVLDGEVRVEHSYALTREEKQKGWVLCCQATPVSDCLHIAFKGDQ